MIHIHEKMKEVSVWAEGMQTQFVLEGETLPVIEYTLEIIKYAKRLEVRNEALEDIILKSKDGK